MSAVFSRPPPPLPPPPVAPSRDDPAVEAARKRTVIAARNARGRSATVLPEIAGLRASRAMRRSPRKHFWEHEQMSTPIKIQAAGVYLQATTSTGDRVAMPGFGIGAQVLAYNDSAQLAFIEFGTSDVSATGGTGAPDIPLPPGAMLALTRPAWATHVSGITNADSADLYFAFGEGA